MRNIKLTLAYDGTDFHGWQIQPGQLTVQGLLTKTLQQLTQQSVIVYGAGRTDAGVHAWGQVANFSTPHRLSPADFARGLNALLPPSVRIRSAKEVGPDFHARWGATAKTYIYRIYHGSVVPPFHWRYCHQESGLLDFSAMQEAARAFIGEHDFTTFAASTGSDEVDQDRVTRRSIFQSEFISAGASSVQWLPDGLPWFPTDSDEWVYVIRGRSFMRNMVRKIVGALIEVGRGRLQPSDIPRLIELRDRTRSGPTIPPQGLCLVSVEYPLAPDSGPIEIAGLGQGA
jgi:tRNA pseudouridine38-40 synthase